jgi:hypothetical protein
VPANMLQTTDGERPIQKISRMSTGTISKWDLSILDLAETSHSMTSW